MLGTSVAVADRGGWADPPGGWTFVEEWHQIPLYDYDPDVSPWNHNNGSDQYTENAMSADFAEWGS